MSINRTLGMIIKTRQLVKWHDHRSIEMSFQGLGVSTFAAASAGPEVQTIFYPSRRSPRKRTVGFIWWCQYPLIPAKHPEPMKSELQYNSAIYLTGWQSGPYKKQFLLIPVPNRNSWNNVSERVNALFGMNNREAMVTPKVSQQHWIVQDWNSDTFCGYVTSIFVIISTRRRNEN
jgi:hypothetical protein